MNCIKFALFLVLVLHISTEGFCKRRKKAARIVGGTGTRISQVPYVVQLRQNNRFLCGGALIAPRFVVTAAHCMQGVTANQLSVVGGATGINQAGVRRSASKVIRPRGYSSKTFNKDIAVIKLSSRMSGKNIATIPLNTQRLTTGTTLRVSGWGLPSENSSGLSKQLRTVTVPIVSRQRCAIRYMTILSLTRTMFCAAGLGKDACTGDSGGPAVCNGRLCGIVSFGIGCARSEYPGVYTSTRSVAKFIRSALKQ
ncbi:seminase-like [Haematobia irritans]|uniref:seminase-like n=1 Tax=Haematobia irritans TaxID=7368 RepID=UPI003F507223